MVKAQAAMEFLMTYGWAILVVLAAIGALAYFGVFNPEKFSQPERVYNESCANYICHYTADAPVEIAVTQNKKTCYDTFNGQFVQSVTCTKRNTTG